MAHGTRHIHGITGAALGWEVCFYGAFSCLSLLTFFLSRVSLLYPLFVSLDFGMCIPWHEYHAHDQSIISNFANCLIHT